MRTSNPPFDKAQGVPSLYIHWPYCAIKCPYCDFNVHIERGEIDEAAWVSALLQDLSWQLQGQDLAPLQTLYFGGGTPSRLSPAAIEALIRGALALWPRHDNPQITLEVHPTSVDQAKFDAYGAAGVNRVSIGVQSFDANALAFLGRDHSPIEAAAAVAHARQTFDKVSLDLMTALPNMRLEDQARQIQQALDMGVDHLSVYQLGIEPGTAFGKAVREGLWSPMDADRSADFFQAAIDQVTAAGFSHYEVSNFAKPGFESRHSLLGWQGRAYVGIGPGAEGRARMDNGTWRQRLTRKSPQGYLRQVEETGHGLDTDAEIGGEERAVEQLIFGLRMTEGLPLTADAWAVSSPARIHDLIQNGDLIDTSSHRRATDQGRLRLDALTDYLINYER